MRKIGQVSLGSLGLPMTFAIALGVAAGCGKKEGSGGDSKGEEKKKAEPLKMVPTPLPVLKLSMEAPEGAEVRGTNVVFVRKGDAFGIDVQKDIFGVSGDNLIIPFEKKLLKKKLVDEPELQIWTKDMAGKDVVLFALVVKVGEQKYYVQSNGMGMFDRGQVDVMVKAARTLKAQQGLEPK